MLGDTMLNSMNYKKIYSTYATWSSFTPAPILPGNYIGAIRQDISAKKVYYADYNGTENLLYDFSLQTGDISGIDSSNGVYDSIRVIAVDSVLVSGSYNRRFILKSDRDPPNNTPGNIIEGVGNEAGILSEYTGGFEFSNQLLCLALHNVPVYPDGAANPSPGCAYPVGIGELKNGEITLTVMPNPVSEHIFIKCNDGFTLEILDNKGCLVLQRKDVPGNETRIDLSDYASGIYFIRISNKKGNTITKKVVKE
jgi:hypothetical protein